MRHVYSSPFPDFAMFAILYKTAQIAEFYEKRGDTEIAGLVLSGLRKLMDAYELMIPVKPETIEKQ